MSRISFPYCPMETESNTKAGNYRKRGLTNAGGCHIIFLLVQADWRDGRVVYGAGLENQWYREVPGVRIPLSPPILYCSSDLQKYPRGRRGSPAKGVGCVKRREGSNPSFCARKEALRFQSFFYFILPCFEAGFEPPYTKQAIRQKIN